MSLQMPHVDERCRRLAGGRIPHHEGVQISRRREQTKVRASLGSLSPALRGSPHAADDCRALKRLVGGRWRDASNIAIAQRFRTALDRYPGEAEAKWHEFLRRR
jgi:hypothetical protein